MPIAGTGLPGDVDWVSGVRIAWIVRKKQALSDLFFSYAPEAIRTPDARFRKAIMFVEISTVYVSGGAVGSSFFKHF